MTFAAKKLLLSLLLSFCAAYTHGVSAATDQAASTNLPVRTIGGYLMVVSVSINDRGPFDFLVDTGTNTTLIVPELAKELRLTPKDSLQLASLASSTNVPRYYLQTFRVGPAS